MMDVFKQEILQKIAEFGKTGKTLVFSTEIIARSYLEEAARYSGAVCQDAAISWDTFKNRFMKVPQGCERATVTDRFVFVSSFLNKPESFRSLKAYANYRFEEGKRSYVREISSYLSSFLSCCDCNGQVKLEFLPCLSNEEIHDIGKIVPAYLDFMNERHLYEASFCETDFSDATSYILVMPECIRDNAVFDALEHCDFLAPSIEKDDLEKLNVYINAAAETKNTIRNVFDLLASHSCLPSDIAITCADLANYKPFLLAEAEKYGLELAVMSGAHLTDYSAGRFFRDICTIFNEKFSFDSVKNFLVNPAYPFKNSCLCSAFITSAAELRVGGSSFESWENKFAKYCNEKHSLRHKEEAKTQLEFLQGLRLGLERIKDCAFEELPESIMSFARTFLKEKTWILDYYTEQSASIESRVFSRCMKVLQDSVLKMPQGHVNNVSFLNTLVDIFDKTTYKSNEYNGCVRVFEYPMTAGLCVKHHFVIGLSDDSTSEYIVPLRFVSKEKQNVTNLTDRILSVYARKTDGLVLSGTENSFDSAKVLPAMYLNEDLQEKHPVILRDSFFYEFKEFYPQVFYSRKQKEAFEKSHPDYDGSVVLPSLSFPFEIATSSLKDYDDCPYMGIAKKLYCFDELYFSILKKDDAKIGTAIHNSFEKALERFGSFNNINEEVLFELFDDEIKNLSTDSKALPEYVLKYMSDKVKSDMHEILSSAKSDNADVFLTSSVYAIEDKAAGLYNFKDKLHIKGKPDLVFKNNDGAFMVMDIKKSAEKYLKTLQLYVYAKIIEIIFGNVVSGCFLSVKECSKYLKKKQWKDFNEFHEVEINAQSRLETLANSVEKGKFETKFDSGSYSHCRYCSLGQLCRGGYKIK